MTWPFENLPQFRYGAILVDPPWRMKMYSVKGMGRSPDGERATRSDGYYRNGQRQNNPERHYATMALDDIIGWIARRSLVGTHHGEWSVLMQWLCACPMVKPRRDA